MQNFKFFRGNVNWKGNRIYQGLLYAEANDVDGDPFFYQVGNRVLLSQVGELSYNQIRFFNERIQKYRVYAILDEDYGNVFNCNPDNQTYPSFFTDNPDDYFMCEYIFNPFL